MRVSVLDQAVSEVDGGESFAGAGGRLDESAKQTSGEGRLQVDDGFDLRGPKAGGVERWKLAEASRPRPKSPLRGKG